MSEAVRRGIRTAQVGLLLNAALALVKLLAGIFGNSYALIADGVESTADVFSSIVVWGGLRISARSADEDYHFGYGKAESMAAAVVGLMMLAAAVGIAVESVREIRTPHEPPAPFTLAVLVGVVVIKELLFRRVSAVGSDVGSGAVQADAWHHRSDAITSAAAFLGISVALLGGPGWEVADEWAAIVAAGIIFFNGVAILRRAAADLMDRAPGEEMLERVRIAAEAVPDVQATEKLKIRKAGMSYFVDLHVQADPGMSLHDAHILSGRVKTAIRRDMPEILGVLIHMEPFEDFDETGGGAGG